MRSLSILLCGYGWFAGIPEGETNNAELIARALDGETLVVDEILPDGSVLPALLKKIPAASCRVRTAGGNAPFAMCKWLSEEKKLPDVYLAFDFG